MWWCRRSRYCGYQWVAFRKVSPKNLLISAALCFVFMLTHENRSFYQRKKVIERGEIVAAIDTTKTKLSDKQKEELSAMTEFRERYTAEKKLKRMAKTTQQVTGSYEDVYEFRTNGYIDNLVEYLYFGVWDVLLFMFIGMAFFKMGIMIGQAPPKVYWWLAIVGLGLGLPLSYLPPSTRH